MSMMIAILKLDPSCNGSKGKAKFETYKYYISEPAPCPHL